MSERTDQIKRRSLSKAHDVGGQYSDKEALPAAAGPVAAPAPRTATAPLRGMKSATKCIYFRNVDEVDQVERLIQRTPTASMSSILAQLLSAFVAQGLPQAQSGKRVVILNNVEVVI